MALTDRLIVTAKRYAKAKNLSLARVSTLVLGSGHRLGTVMNGGKVYTSTFEAAMQWLSDNWPDDVDWPEGVDRPAPQPKCEADE